MSSQTTAEQPLRRVRVLLVSEPGFAGVKRHVIDMLMHIDLARFELGFVYSLARQDATFQDEIKLLRARGVQCWEVPMTRSIRPWQDFSALLKVCRIILDFKPAIVHGHSSKAGFIARTAARLVPSHARTVYTPNAMACIYSRLYWFIEKVAGYLTDCLVAASPSEAADFLRWRIVPQKRIAGIPLNIRSEYRYPDRAARQGASILIATCGRISQQKNGLLFFKTAIEVMARHPEVRFQWIGSFDTDQEAEEVRRFIKEEPGAEKVEVTGWVSDAEDRIAEADIFCLLSQYESFGYVVADAMAMELPVVATRVSGLVDLVQDGTTGLLCDPDKEQICNALSSLITDPLLRRTMGRRGREHVLQHFTLENTVRRTEALYSSLTNVSTSEVIDPRASFANG